MGVKYTNIITSTHPMSVWLAIFDKDGNRLKGVMEYNIETREAKVVKYNEFGKPEFRWLNSENPSLFPRFEGDICGRELIIEDVVLEGSKLMFREPISIGI